MHLYNIIINSICSYYNFTSHQRCFPEQVFNHEHYNSIINDRDHLFERKWSLLLNFFKYKALVTQLFQPLNINRSITGIFLFLSIMFSLRKSSLTTHYAIFMYVTPVFLFMQELNKKVIEK